MSFTLIPNSGQSLGQTRAPIRTNFSVLQTAQDVNHVALNASGAGKHKFLQMPEQGSAPTTASNEGGFYTKVGTSPAETNLFFRAESNGNEYQLTRVIAASTATFGTNTAYAANHTGGWMFLAGNMLLQYGLRSSPGSSGVITFPIAFTNTPYSISVSLYRASGDHNVLVSSGTVPTTTGFNYICDTSGSVGVYWYAIGV